MMWHVIASHRVAQRDPMTGSAKQSSPGWIAVASLLAMTRSSLPDQLQPLVLGQHGHAVLLGFRQFRTGTGPGNHIIRLLRHRARGLGAKPFGQSPWLRRASSFPASR